MTPPLAASAGAADILVDLFVVLLAAKIGDEIFKRIRQPALVGEILAGVIIGPSVLGIVSPDETLEVFAELGVVARGVEIGQVPKRSFGVGRLEGSVHDPVLATQGGRRNREAGVNPPHTTPNNTIFTSSA